MYTWVVFLVIICFCDAGLRGQGALTLSGCLAGANLEPGNTWHGVGPFSTAGMKTGLIVVKLSVADLQSQVPAPLLCKQKQCLRAQPCWSLLEGFREGKETRKPWKLVLQSIYWTCGWSLYWPTLAS